MLKSGVSYNVYMKRVWIFDEALSPACFFLYVWALSCFRVRASKAVPAKFGKERANKGFRGQKRQGQAFFPPSNHSLSVLVRLAKMLLSFFLLSDLKKKSAPHV